MEHEKLLQVQQNVNDCRHLNQQNQSKTSANATDLQRLQTPSPMNIDGSTLVGLKNMKKKKQDGVNEFDLSILFDAHGL